jgi:hypothetical protein
MNIELFITEIISLFIYKNNIENKFKIQLNRFLCQI